MNNKIIVVINNITCLFTEKMIASASARYQKNVKREEAKKQKEEIKAMKKEEKLASKK